jgi:DNA-binding winged helix-turn-helix (wHTH) protein
MESHTYAFGRFRVDVASGQLSRDGVHVPLPAKAFETLVVLIRHRDRVVSQDELVRVVSPDTLVSDDRVTGSISSLQRIFGHTKVIATVPPRGYRFIEPVTENPPPDWDQLRAGARVRSRGRKLRPVATAGALRSPAPRLSWLVLIVTLAAIVAALLVIANWPALLAR